MLSTVKRKIISLEESWRAKFAARDLQPGLQGNNNTELARAMRAWIAFRDEEERVKREKEEDEKALEVRRERLHELESERLGLTDVCRYETTVGGVEENRLQSVDTDGRTNPISLEDAVNQEPQQSRPDDGLYRNLQPTESNGKPGNSDSVAPIVELLRKRQREEREEADIRREEQVLLNKRLAMMEEQVQMLCKVVTQREQKSQPAPPPRPAVIGLDGDVNESTEVPPRPESNVRAVEASNNTGAPAEIVEVSPDMPMPDIPANTTAGSKTAAVETRKSNDAPIEVAENSPNVSMDESADVLDETAAGSETAAVDTSKSNDAPTGIVQYSPNVSMDESADVLDETPAESGTGILDDTAEAQVDVDDSLKTTDAPTAGEAEAEPEDTSAVQATESANEESPASSISEEE